MYKLLLVKTTHTLSQRVNLKNDSLPSSLVLESRKDLASTIQSLVIISYSR